MKQKQKNRKKELKNEHDEKESKRKERLMGFQAVFVVLLCKSIKGYGSQKKKGGGEEKDILVETNYPYLHSSLFLSSLPFLSHFLHFLHFAWRRAGGHKNEFFGFSGPKFPKTGENFRTYILVETNYPFSSLLLNNHLSLVSLVCIIIFVLPNPTTSRPFSISLCRGMELKETLHGPTPRWWQVQVRLIELIKATTF